MRTRIPEGCVRRAKLVLAVMWGIGVVSAGAAQLTYPDLVSRLTDLDALAVPPPPGERCEQASSYDRASRWDPAAGKYVGWDANGDGDGFVRREGERIVMAEMEGPGCIWRIWSAAPKQGHVRMYLDGAEKPVVDLPFLGYFDGSQAPFTRSALVHTVALGWNNYTPIPFQKSCRIVADPGWGQYYQVVYSRFPAGTQVPTFRRDLAPADAAALDAANQVLTSGGPRQLSGHAVHETLDWTLAPNGGSQRQRLVGPAAVVSLRVKVEDLPPAPADRAILRELTLSLKWDGEEEPSVWSPLGDFFGTAPGANRYRSLPCGLDADGWWYANWYMPFAEAAELTLRNEGAQGRRVRVEVATTKLSGNPASLARFHAKWHRDGLAPAETERRAIDWTLLKTEGRGRFVGVMLHVWNPKGGWWGEGDEKFLVDGERFPSTFGTGSEDYFGYAWCNPTLFQNAYHNQTISMNNRGHVSVNRWHVADSIPFQTAFDGSIEKYFPNSRPTLYAATVYWYQMAGGKDPYRPVALAERTGYWDDTVLQPKFVRGALEAERMKVVKCTGGTAAEQDMSGFGGDWSGDSQLWWTQAKPGQQLVLTLPVAEPGKYRLRAQFTRAIDYGIVQVSLDGRKLGAPIDLYHDGVVASGELVLGSAELKRGDHALELEIMGAHPKAVKGYMVGLDFVVLERLP